MAEEKKEKYLSIKLAGHDYVAAWKNKNKEKDNQPDYKGDGVAVWVRMPKDKKEAAEDI